MQVHTAPMILKLPRNTDRLVNAMFDASRRMLKKAGGHSPTVITLFGAGEDYIAHYHVLERGLDEGPDVPSIAPIIRKELPDGFMMISEAVVEVKDKNTKKLGPANQQGDALFLVLHSKTANILMYQIFTRKIVNGRVQVKMGYKFRDDRPPLMPGLGNLAELNTSQPSYIA